MLSFDQSCLICGTLHHFHESDHHCCNAIVLVPDSVYQAYSDWLPHADDTQLILAIRDLTAIFQIWPSHCYDGELVAVLVHVPGLPEPPKPDDTALMPRHIHKLIIGLPEPLQLPTTKTFLRMSTMKPPQVSVSQAHRTTMQAQPKLPFDRQRTVTFPKPTPIKKPAPWLALVAAASAAIAFCVILRKP